MNEKKIPLLKEYRIQKLVESLNCINNNKFKRDLQRDCVLSFYKSKKNIDVEKREKSIFRGMVIPTLRYLGLIVNFGDSIQLGSNGKLILESRKNIELHNRVLRLIILEIDFEVFNFIKIIEKSGSFLLNEFQNTLSKIITGSSLKQKKERINKWLSYLKQVSLIKDTNKFLAIKELNYIESLNDYNINRDNLNLIKEIIYNSYKKLTKEKIGVIDIRLLRECVAINALRKEIILSERKIDNIINMINFDDDGYLVSFGKPMGAGEKLLNYKGKNYRTITLSEIKKLEGNNHG